MIFLFLTSPKEQTSNKGFFMPLKYTSNLNKEPAKAAHDILSLAELFSFHLFNTPYHRLSSR